MYGKSLYFGTQYVYHSLPRLLTLWFQWESTYKPDPKDQKKAPQKLTLSKLGNSIMTLFSKIPIYVWYIVYPQLISRICHPNKEVCDLLLSILSRILQEYPRQSMWGIMAITNSNQTNRSERAQEVINKVLAVKNSPKELISQGESLFTHLLEVSNHKVPNTPGIVLSVSREFPKLHKFMKQQLELIVPTQQALTITLPADGKLPNALYDPFPGTRVLMAGIQDQVDVMNSLQKPRKIIVVGSDSDTYIYLCKPKDDLRKDSRLMEFNSMINRLLKKDPSCRKRNLCNNFHLNS